MRLFFSFFFIVVSFAGRAQTPESFNGQALKRLYPQTIHYLAVVLVILIVSLLGWYLFRLDKRIAVQEAKNK